ncbi:MAG: cytochrome c-type biosis protein CcmE [Sphingomonadales bacterium]|nr:cytochrome c-type biosis protein CcmE [Sphingomonadales bacterium]
MKRKNQRLILLLLAIGAVLGAVLLAMWGLRNNASFFYAPGDIAREGRPPPDRAVRVGGMVRGQIRRLADGVTVEFVIGDNTPHIIRARYTGITPELFRPDSGVIADGHFVANPPRGGVEFVASNILAKHDENYMPPELTQRGMHKTDAVR